MKCDKCNFVFEQNFLSHAKDEQKSIFYSCINTLQTEIDWIAVWLFTFCGIAGNDFTNDVQNFVLTLTEMECLSLFSLVVSSFPA